VPVRVHSWNAELRVGSVRIVGYRVTCSCGERGPVRQSVRSAREAWQGHAAPTAGGAGGT
jgi:hypothetical protein